MGSIHLILATVRKARGIRDSERPSDPPRTPQQARVPSRMDTKVFSGQFPGLVYGSEPPARTASALCFCLCCARQYSTGAKVVGLGISREPALALASSVIWDMFPISLNFGQPKSGNSELCLLRSQRGTEVTYRASHHRVWLDVSSGDFL